MAERARLLNLKKLKLPHFGKKRRHQGSVTAIDMEGSMLRVVLTVPRGQRMAVTRIAAEKLDLGPEADLTDPTLVGRAIAKALDRLRIKPSAVVMGIPRATVVLRTITLPVLPDMKDLASMVHFQIGRDLPFRLEEAVVDFKVRRQIPVFTRSEVGGKSAETAEDSKGEGEGAGTKLEVLVAAVKREVVAFYVQTALAAGLKLSALGLLSYANARCLEACRVAHGDESIALISLRPDEVGIDLVSHQTLLFSRGAAIKLRTEPTPATGAEAAEATGPGDTTAFLSQSVASGEQLDPLVEAVTIEVVRSLHSYSGMDPQSTIAKAVVVGATGQEPAVVEALQYRLNLPCTWLDLGGTLELPKAAREHAAGSISAIGLAFSLGDPLGLPFDFLHPKRPAVPRNLTRLRLIMGAAAAVAVLLFVSGLRSYLVQKAERQRQELAAQLKEAEKKRPLYKQMRTQTATVDDWINEGRSWLEHYLYLSAVLPSSEQVYLTSFSISGQGTIRMAVQARSGEILSQLDKQLRAAGYDVKPLAITPGTDRFGYEFRTMVELSIPDKMKMDLSALRPPARPPDDASLDPAIYRKGVGR